MPNFPQRLKYITSGISIVGEKLIITNQELLELTDSTGCEFAQSQCDQIISEGKQVDCRTLPESFGSVYPLEESGSGSEDETAEEKISSKRSAIKGLNVRISYYRKLLAKEMETGLENQLQTLREEDAEELRSSIEEILNTLPELIAKGEDSAAQPNKCSTNNCTPQCNQGGIGDTMCIDVALSGEQKPTQITFEGGIGIDDDWDLGRIGISNIKLNLPDTLKTPDLPTLKIPKIKINIPGIKIDCALRSQEIEIKSPTVSLPNPPKLEFSCPDYNTAKNYQYQYPPCLQEDGTYAPCSQDEKERYREFEWFLEVFSWLSSQCMDAIWETVDWKDSAETDKLNNSIPACFDPVTTASKLVQVCGERYAEQQAGRGPLPRDDACWYWFGGKTDTQDKPKLAAEEHCFKFFEGIQNLPGRPGFKNNDGSQRTFDPGTKDKIIEYLEDQNPGITIDDEPQDQCGDKLDSLTTLIDSCKKLRELHPDKQPGEFPDQCKILPRFFSSILGYDPPYQIAAPDILEWIAAQHGLPEETMIDLPNNPFPGCSIGAPSIPKIPLSKYSIIIPDIELPTFNLGPFFSIKLPSFVFEDLTFPDIELCNLDDCQFKMPNLSFQPPTLKIPEIAIATSIFTLPSVPGNPKVEVNIEPPEFSPLRFDFSQIINLNSLVSPELELPEFKLPKPKLKLSFEDVKVDFLNLLLGLLGIPNFQAFAWACFPGLDIDAIPLVIPSGGIAFPDFHFSWPAFPDIPEIGFCEDARQFCRNANSAIQEIASKTKEIEKIIEDQLINDPDSIQKKLDAAAAKINSDIAAKIKDELENPIDGVAAKIEKAINDHLAFYPIKSTDLPPAPIPGIFPVAPESACQGVPPLTVTLNDYIEIDEEIDINYVLRQLGLDTLPDKINLKDVWPDDLKNLKLSCDEAACDACENQNTTVCRNLYLDAECPSLKDFGEFLECKIDRRINKCKNECNACLSYDLPAVPLCRLSYSRKETINLPGFQLNSPQVSFSDPLGSGSGCYNGPPTGNACLDATSQIQSNIDIMQNLSRQLNEASKKIENVLK